MHNWMAFCVLERPPFLVSEGVHNGTPLFSSIFRSIGPGLLQNAKISTQNDGDIQTDNNVIEPPPLLLKNPFHQDDDDEKAFSGFTNNAAKLVGHNEI